MQGKWEIIGDLGEQALLLPDAVTRGLEANDRLRYCFRLLELAERHAREPGAELSTQRAEREAIGIEEPELDEVVPESRCEDGIFRIPHADRIHRLMVECVDDMLAPLVIAGFAGAGPPPAVVFRDRLQAILSVLPAVAGDRVAPSYVAGTIRTDRPDSLHRLVADVQGELNRLQQSLSRETIDGAQVYRISEEDRALVRCYMAGVNETAALKFDHAALGTTATRSGDILLIRSDIGAAEAHVLVVRVAGLTCTVTHADPHLQRARFFQGLLARFGVEWVETHAREARWREQGEAYHVCTGRVALRDAGQLQGFLTLLGSRIVFLIDWNRARKRLRNFVDGAGCIEVLRWAADQHHGHRAFLLLGGERLVYEAVEHATPSPIRYGQRLDEVLGREEAVAFLKFVLRVTSEGLRQRRSERLIHDEIRAELSGRFQTPDQVLLGVAVEHAMRISEVAGVVREGLRAANGDRAGALARNAQLASRWEQEADDLLDRGRGLAQASGAHVYGRVLSEADDAADGLEEAAFLLTLLPAEAAMAPFRGPLEDLAGLVHAAAEAWGRCLAAASTARKRRASDELQLVLEAVDKVVTTEHEVDDAQRAVTAALFRGSADGRVIQLLLLVAQALEQASDALAHAALRLRDHLLEDPSFR